MRFHAFPSRPAWLHAFPKPEIQAFHSQTFRKYRVTQYKEKNACFPDIDDSL